MKKDCEYRVGKYRSIEPGGGALSSLIKALFLLNNSLKIVNSLVTLCASENDAVLVKLHVNSLNNFRIIAVFSSKSEHKIHKSFLLFSHPFLMLLKRKMKCEVVRPV